MSLLALSGLRVSEATGADIEALGTERGHRTLAIIRKGARAQVIVATPDRSGGCGGQSWVAAGAGAAGAGLSGGGAESVAGLQPVQVDERGRDRTRACLGR